MNALMTLTMMFSLNIIKTTGDCPRYCECKWKSGKESVLCANANMTEVPRHLDSGTQLLDLTGNRIQSIGPDEFFNASLLNLQKIFLSRCRLRFLDKSSFRKIINLVELDLSYNELHSVPSHTFEFITELRELRLNGNPIIRVLNNAFKMVPRLTKLDLSECRIGYVEIKAFQGLESSLEWLKLDKNKIVNIKPLALVNLGNLHGLELSGNPWNCSCGLRMLREWMLKQNVPYSIPPVCKYPSRLIDKDWDKLDLDEFACVPRIEAIFPRKIGEEGSNVTLGCFVYGVPDPTVRWLRKNHFLVNVSSPSSSTAAAAAAGTAEASPGTSGKPKIYVVESEKERSNLMVLTADLQDSGVYVCRAENKAGKSEANITLAITVRTVVRIWSSRMIAAAGVVFLLFALAVALLTFCAWSSRKRKFSFRHPVNSRDYDGDGYEMNHKKPINYNKIVDYGNHYTTNPKSTHISGKETRSESFSERAGDPSRDGAKVGDFSTSQTSGSNGISREENTSDVDERLNGVSGNRRFSPDLHIRLNEHENRKGFPCTCSGNQFSEKSSTMTYAMASSASFREFDPRFSLTDSKPEIDRTFYVDPVRTSQSQKFQVRGKYPDLLELSKNTENLINNNAFCTVPRKLSYKTKKSRRESVESESQSPLLPGSSNDSCDSDSRRSSIESALKNGSLPTSPGNLNQSQISSVTDEAPKTLKYKSWKLEKFLKEYRSLQDQLYKMKESCENLTEESVPYQGESNAPANATLANQCKFISSSSAKPSSANSFLRARKNLDNLNSLRELAEEDNNNPEGILKSELIIDGNMASATMRDSCGWSPGTQILEPLTEGN